MNSTWKDRFYSILFYKTVQNQWTENLTFLGTIRLS